MLSAPLQGEEGGEGMMTTGMYTSNTPEWGTPQDFFDELNKEFKFTLDPCSTKENAKCKRFFTKEDDGLSKEWTGRVFMNPPYGRGIGAWIKKAYDSTHTHTAQRRLSSCCSRPVPIRATSMTTSTARQRYGSLKDV